MAIQCPILKLYKDCVFEDYVPFVFYNRWTCHNYNS